MGIELEAGTGLREELDNSSIGAQLQSDLAVSVLLK